MALRAGHSSDDVPGTSSCSWSSVWQSIAIKPEEGAQLTPARRRKGSLERPRPNPGERYDLEGPWILSAVVDAKGKVVDARVIKSASDPPWPRYEAHLLKGLRKFEFTPALANGRAV